MKQVSYIYKLYVFDLDDTLYPEKDFLFAAYHRIAQTASSTPGQVDQYTQYLCDTFVREGRKNLFQKFQQRFALTMSIEQMVDLMRHTACSLKLYEPMERLLSDLLNQGKQVAILTNGNVTQQKQKVVNLRLLERFPSIDVWYADEIAPKPSPLALQQLMARHHVLPEETLFIGDSSTDRETAQSAGVNFESLNL